MNKKYIFIVLGACLNSATILSMNKKNEELQKKVEPYENFIIELKQSIQKNCWLNGDWKVNGPSEKYKYCNSLIALLKKHNLDAESKQDTSN